MWARTLFLILAIATICLSASVNLYLKNITLVNEEFGKACAKLGSQSLVTCGVLRGKNTTLSGTWVVDGSSESLALKSLKFSWKWSDWKGDTLDKTVCQITGGAFEIEDNPCTQMVVPPGDYPLKPYYFKMINPSSLLRLVKEEYDMTKNKRTTQKPIDWATEFLYFKS